MTYFITFLYILYKGHKLKNGLNTGVFEGKNPIL